MKSLGVAAWLIVTGLVLTFLVVADNLMIPFVIALVVVFLIKSLTQLISRLKVGSFSLPGWMCFTLALLSIFGFFFAVGTMIGSTINAMTQSADKYKINLESVADRVLAPFGVDTSMKLSKYLGEFDFSTIIGEVLNMVSGVAGNFLLILVYAGFLLLESRIIDKKVHGLFPENDDYDRVQLIIKRVNEATQTYISVKTFTSILTGLLSYFVLLSVGVDFAPFWAFLIFLLNFIPSIGSLIATIFPVLLAVVQFPTLTPAIILLACIAAIQLVIGNIVEPKMMGNSLNISPFVVILSLSVWGVIWGVAGMFLCIPITVIMMIIFAQFNSTRPIAIMLSASGTVDEISYPNLENIRPGDAKAPDEYYQRT